MNVFLSKNQKQKKDKIGLSNINKIIKVEVPAGGAAITPPLGPVLGQYGMNTMDFCKEFNEETKIMEKETILPILIYLSSDKNFFFEIKTPGIAYLLKKFLESNELQKIGNEYLLEKKEFLKIVYQISLLKILMFSKKENQLNLVDKKYFKNYINSIIGTARSFNIKII